MKPQLRYRSKSPVCFRASDIEWLYFAPTDAVPAGGHEGGTLDRIVGATVTQAQFSVQLAGGNLL